MHPAEGRLFYSAMNFFGINASSNLFEEAAAFLNMLVSKEIQDLVPSGHFNLPWRKKSILQFKNLCPEITDDELYNIALASQRVTPECAKLNNFLFHSKLARNIYRELDASNISHGVAAKKMYAFWKKDKVIQPYE